ncbi:J domain-containing protein [Variovorax guangxiensis]|nr:J domain-containing protein [Variovorax guangxiensis]
MDPYEVLGIRPDASEQELELAYRSRRAQYHRTSTPKLMP